MNRTGTKSFHHLFTQSGYESVHYSTYNPEGGAPIIIGEMISDRVELGDYNRKPLLLGAERFTAYSDMFFHRGHKWCDGVKVFKQLEAEYPDSYFVLQTRPKKLNILYLNYKVLLNIFKNYEGNIFSAYLTSIIESVNPKLVITTIDNSLKFFELSKAKRSNFRSGL